MGDYDEILKDFPNDRVTQCGTRHRTAPTLGRIKEALQAVDRILDSSGLDVVAACIKAGILHDQNNLDEAAKLYNQVIAHDALNINAYIGLGTTLKYLNRFDEAMQVFDKTITQFRQDSGGYAGRAGVHKARGDLDAALRDYEYLITKNSTNLIAINGKASILAALGDFQSATELLPTHAPSKQSEWISHHIRAMITLKQGFIVAAMHMFSYGLTNMPWFYEKQYYQTALSVALIKQRKFEEAVGLLNTDVAPDLFP